MKKLNKIKTNHDVVCKHKSQSSVDLRAVKVIRKLLER